MTCSVCGGGYVLIGDLCGECLLVVNGSWGDAPGPSHVEVVQPDGSSPKYLAGWHDSWEHLHRVSGVASAARAARAEARTRPLRPVVIGKW